MRSKRVLRVTLMRLMPRSESSSRNVRFSRLTERTVPSNSAAEAAAGAVATRAVTMTGIAMREIFMPTASPVAWEGPANGR